MTAITKRCAGCHSDLPQHAFHRDRTRSDRLSIYCKRCKCAQVADYYEAHRDEVLARKAARGTT